MAFDLRGRNLKHQLNNYFFLNLFALIFFLNRHLINVKYSMAIKNGVNIHPPPDLTRCPTITVHTRSVINNTIIQTRLVMVAACHS